MRLTVIIPVHNRARLVKRAVSSVLAQTVLPERVVVVDDGSDDDPKEQLVGLDRGHLVHVIRREHAGVSAARNTGIRASDTTWLAFLDSDDRWLPDKIEKQFRWHQEHPGVQVSQTDEIWIRHGRRVNPKKYHEKPEGDIFRASLERCLISPSAVIIRRAVFNDIGLFDESLPVCEDYDLWLRLTSSYRVGLVPEKLVVKTGGHDDQLSKRFWGMDRFRVRAINKILNSGQLTADQRQAALAVLAAKTAILRNGALKRRNFKLVRELSEG